METDTTPQGEECTRSMGQPRERKENVSVTLIRTEQKQPSNRGEQTLVTDRTWIKTTFTAGTQQDQRNSQKYNPKFPESLIRHTNDVRGVLDHKNGNSILFHQ